MKPRPTQFGVRENTASSRQHASRLAVDSLPSMSEAAPERFATSTADSQSWHPVQASRTSQSLLCRWKRPQGEKREIVPIAFSAPATVITAKESRQVPVTPEPFVSADEAAQFLCVKRRYLLELARRGIAGAYALGTGASARSGCFGSRNSRPPLYGTKPRFQNHKNRVRSDLAVPAESEELWLISEDH